jgi:hypothetical protein
MRLGAGGAGHHVFPARGLALFGGVVLVSALMAGCGGSSAASHATPTPQTAAYTCPAGQTSMGIPNNAVIVKGSDQQHEVSVGVGQVVVIELAPQLRWSYDPAASDASNLMPQQPTGALDSAVNVCFWQWQAHSTGTAQLTFRGQPNCTASQQNCPALTPGTGEGTAVPTNPSSPLYVSQMHFTVHVS